MKIDIEDVKKAAETAKIHLESHELERYKKNLEDMTQEFLDALKVLGVKVDGNFDFTSSSSKRTVLREDIVDIYELTSSIINNAPSVDRGLFSVPTILNGDE